MSILFKEYGRVVSCTKQPIGAYSYILFFKKACVSHNLNNLDRYIYCQQIDSWWQTLRVWNIEINIFYSCGFPLPYCWYRYFVKIRVELFEKQNTEFQIIILWRLITYQDTWLWVIIHLPQSLFLIVVGSFFFFNTLL